MENKAQNDFNIDDIDTSEVPEEYLDAMLYEIMTDPVKLPGSGAVVDR